MQGIKYVCGLIIGTLLLCAAQNVQAEWYYRVIARDDSLEAQAEKLRIRDAVNALCPEREEAFLSALPEVKKTVQSIAPCRLDIRNWSPDQGTPLAPTLYITVGEGRGHNCWGVLYADSLRMAQAEEIPEEPEKVEFVWLVWSWILSLLGL